MLLSFTSPLCSMNPKQFLQVGGVILLLLGIIGFLVPNLLGDLLWFDSAENVAHTVLGIVALIAAGAPLGAGLRKGLVIIVGLVALFFGVMGFVVAGNAAPNFYGVTNLEMLDNIVHIAVGVWAFLASMGKEM